MNLTGGNGGKHVATTARKTKPDGSREVTHKVEHHFGSTIGAMRKAKIGKDRTYKEEKPMRLLKPLDTGRIHHALITHGEGHHRGQDLQQTLEALRAYRSHELVGRGAFEGDGRLERQAPGLDLQRMLFEDGSGIPLNHPYGAGSAESYPTDGAELGNDTNPYGVSHGTLVPRYKGGLRRQSPI
jgi:hypothetical protein